jgi:cyclophilin family peptidyl-prolyl cis-trans isomerase
VALAAAVIASALNAPLGPVGAASADTQVTSYVNATVTIDTTFGVIVAMMYEEGAPITTGNFINLTARGFYDGIKFHRIVDNFVIQTGDPNTKDNNPYNDGMGGSGTTIPLEINDTLLHEDGALGMARSSDPNSASSQFYICDGAQHGLDGNYSVFGIVVEGIEVVREIASQPTNGLRRPLLQEQPVNDIVMTHVTVTYGFWNNTTVPGGPADGVAGILAGPAGAGIGLLLVVIVAAALLFVLPGGRQKARTAVTRAREMTLGRLPARLRRTPRG